MKVSVRIAILLLCSFFFVVLAFSFAANRHFPIKVVGGENSVGAWMSDALLIFMAALCLFMSMTRRWYPWLFFAAFFMLLALDERFMFHEQIKQRILFSSSAIHMSRWIYELPVIIGAVVGFSLSFVLWRHLPVRVRLFLPFVVAFGAASVVIDVIGAGVLWEESCKLMAELLMACILLRTAGGAEENS